MLVHILQSEIEFHEAYQDFINYKNICEIVAQAKVSNENLALASDLLNASVEDIHVSVEGLKDKIKSAWNAFVAWWKRLVEGFKDLKARLNFSKLPVLADISRNNLKELYISFSKIYRSKRETIVQDVRKAFSISLESERLEEKKDLAEWIRFAENVSMQLNSIILSKEKMDKTVDVASARDEDIVVMNIILTQGKKLGMKLTKTLVKMKKVENKIN